MDRSWKYIAAAGVVAGLLFSGCSFEASIGDSGLDTDKLEEEITTGIEEQTGVTVESVECPDDVDQEEGNNFECRVVTTDGEQAQVRVVQVDDDGNVEWNVIQE